MCPQLTSIQVSALLHYTNEAEFEEKKRDLTAEESTFRCFTGPQNTERRKVGGEGRKRRSGKRRGRVS